MYTARPTSRSVSTSYSFDEGKRFCSHRLETLGYSPFACCSGDTKVWASNGKRLGHSTQEGGRRRGSRWSWKMVEEGRRRRRALDKSCELVHFIQYWLHLRRLV
ncbi:hypothetical protein PoB_004677900 [Plakobranchus ocellatus]|uniref:Uncharacterized protein n=1 Tax=Plakobranchus ocellatus TaxID=259542 RepID=A0AAV4BN18_9GAST|nr:hypothetical protein PoB_004677900 [Plakobranchus ocellatus]